MGLLCVGVGGLNGCSRGPQSVAARQETVTLKFGIAVPTTGTSSTGVTRFINNFVADSIVGIGWDGKTTDRLVLDDAEWTPDQLALKLRLRPNIKFHDGTSLDRPYFRERLEAILKEPQVPGTNVSYQSVTGVQLDPETDDRVVIKLSRPEAFLLTDLANSTLTNPNKPQIGTGPYKVVTLEPKARLAAFDDYYRGRPKIDFLEIEGFEQLRASWAALMRGQIDAVHEIAPTAIDFVQAEGQTNVRTFPTLRPYYVQVLFNVKHPILKSRAVRQALSYGIDRQAIIDLALNRQGTVAEGPIWPFHWAYSTARKNYTHNTDSATLRLDSAGLKMAGPKVPGGMPSRFRIRCLTLANDARYEKIALILQKQLYEIGVDLEIVTLPGKDLIQRLSSGQFEMLLMERTSGRSLAWTYVAFHSSQNPAGYTAADEVLDLLRRTTAEAGIRTAVSDLQQIFHDDPPAIFILWPKIARVVSSRFAVEEEEGRDVMSRFWLWRAAATSQ